MRSARLAACFSLLVPSLALACSIKQLPLGLDQLLPGQSLPRVDGATDATAPSKPVLSNPLLFLRNDTCLGGALCQVLDWLEFTVEASDAQTPSGEFRYLVAFGTTAAEASASVPSHTFFADSTAPSTVLAWLGENRARSGDGFQRTTLCFTLSAVDDGANISERSDPLCLDTTDEQAAGTTVIQGGARCSCGCGAADGTSALGALGLMALLRRRALRARRAAEA